MYFLIIFSLFFLCTIQKTKANNFFSPSKMAGAMVTAVHYHGSPSHFPVELVAPSLSMWQSYFYTHFSLARSMTKLSIMIFPCGVLSNPNMLLIYRSTFYFLIMSLSVSDLLSALVSILVLYRITWGFDVWHWPDFTCKVSSHQYVFLIVQHFELFCFWDY